MNKKKIVLFGAGKYQEKIIKILKPFYFIIAIDEDKKALSSKYVDIFLNYKFNNTKLIFDYLKKKNINPINIISLNSDSGFLAAERLKKKFGLKLLKKKTLKIFFDKFHLLSFLKKNKFPVSNFYLFRNKNKKNFFIKLRRSSGSRNISFCNDNKYNFIKKSKDYILHQRITGQEIVIDGIVDNSKIISFAISKKIKFKNNKTVSQVIYTKKNILKKNLQIKCLYLIQKFLNLSNYKFGLFHIECILHKSNFYIIDAAPRGPGFFVLEDYVMKRIGKVNIINLVNNNKLKFYSPSKKFNSMLVYFFPTKNGIFKKINFKKKFVNYKFESFKKKNSKTSYVKTDNDRLGSLIIYRKNKINVYKEIKKIQESTTIEYFEKYYVS